MKTETEKRTESERPVSILKDECIWMKAGVVDFRLCDNAYDCTTCGFDKAMSRKATRKPTVVVSWREVMDRKPFFERECRHVLSGRVQYKFCANNYRCNTCEFDQRLDDTDCAAATPPTGLTKVSGFTMAEDCYYHKGHAWARIEHGGYVRLGIDDFTSRLLGRMTEFRLPKIGSKLGQGETGWSMRRREKEAAMLSPMRGTVMATNHRVMREPGLIGKDPYGEGWLMVITPQGLKKNVKGLLFEREATSWLKTEAERLDALVSATCGVPLAATGGEIVEDIFGNLTHLDWDDLVHEFLLT